MQLALPQMVPPRGKKHKLKVIETAPINSAPSCSQDNPQDDRRYLNVHLPDGLRTRINMVKSGGDLSDVLRDIKKEFGEHIPVQSALIVLELSDGTTVEDMEDVPNEYFLKLKQEDAESLQIKWEPNSKNLNF